MGAWGTTLFRDNEAISELEVPVEAHSFNVVSYLFTRLQVA